VPLSKFPQASCSKVAPCWQPVFLTIYSVKGDKLECKSGSEQAARNSDCVLTGGLDSLDLQIISWSPFTSYLCHLTDINITATLWGLMSLLTTCRFYSLIFFLCEEDVICFFRCETLNLMLWHSCGETWAGMVLSSVISSRCLSASLPFPPRFCWAFPGWL